MSAVEDRSNASAMFNCVSMMPSLVATFLLNLQHTNSALILPELFLGVMALFAIFYFFGYVQGKR